jgi:hypothetical protein
MSRFRVLICCSLLLLASSAARAATLNVVGGQLLGAYDVDVDGTLYDVEFLDGTCDDLFSGCNSGAFVFQTQADALAASQALLDQVFLDGVLGTFDTDPEFTNGCAYQPSCSVTTPYGRNGSYADGASAQNLYEGDVDYTYTGIVLRTLDTSGFAGATWARWTAVPEPGTAILLGGALLSLAGRRRLAA